MELVLTVANKDISRETVLNHKKEDPLNNSKEDKDPQDSKEADSPTVKVKAKGNSRIVLNRTNKGPRTITLDRWQKTKRSLQKMYANRLAPSSLTVLKMEVKIRNNSFA